MGGTTLVESKMFEVEFYQFTAQKGVIAGLGPRCGRSPVRYLSGESKDDKEWELECLGPSSL